MDERNLGALQAEIERLEARLAGVEDRPVARLHRLLARLGASRCGRFSLGAVVALGAAVSYAAQISVPYTFTNGTIADAGQVNANFSTTAAAVNDNDSRISLNETDILTNSGLVATNSADILTNTNDISIHTSEIATNATDIFSNASAISVNAAGITTNASDITTHGHGSTYVARTGDTMSGGLNVNETSTGSAGSFGINNPGNAFTALVGLTNGSGIAVYGYNTGTGRAGDFVINNAASSSDALRGRTSGSGQAVYGLQTGTGMAGQFEIQNASSSQPALRAQTNGTGTAIWGWQTGTGRGAFFDLSNPANPNPALETRAQGSGSSIYARQLGSGRGGWFQISNASSAAAALRSETNGLGVAGSFATTNSSNNNPALAGSSNGGGAAVSGFATGTGSAGTFKIFNSSSSKDALYAASNGSGAALYAEATGFGRAATFQKDAGPGTAVRIQAYGSSNDIKPLEVYTSTLADGVTIQIDNTASNATALLVETNGTGGSAHAIRAVGTVSVTGSFYATVKNFIQPHAADPTKEIRYVSMEGPESAVFVRGTARLVQGRATIELPQHFSLVAAEPGVTVQFTPRSLESKGLAAVSVTRERIEVGELLGGSGSYAFDYLVTAERAGFEGHEPVVPNVHFRPRPGETAADFEERFAGDDASTAAIRGMLIANGLLRPDGTLDRTKLDDLGWTIAEATGSAEEQIAAATQPALQASRTSPFRPRSVADVR